MTTTDSLWRSALPVVSTLSFALFGCAATGLDWVREPESGGADGANIGYEFPEAAISEGRTHQSSSALQVTSLQAVDAAEDRRRLDHVVSLGESAAVAREQQSTAASQPGVPIVINVNNYVDSSPGYAPVTSFDSFGGFPARQRSGNGHRRVVPATPRLGQDFPAPPSVGPPFPFRTAPANPWLPAR